MADEWGSETPAWAHAHIVSPEQSNPVSGLAPAYTYGTPITEYAALSAAWAPAAGAGGGGGGGGGGAVVGFGDGVDPPVCVVGDGAGVGDDVGLGAAITGGGGGSGGGGGISAIRSFSSRPPSRPCCAATASRRLALVRLAEAR